ncbi:MAG: autotransporter domain-containing protein [Hyphomonadaceae bacterium]
MGRTVNNGKSRLALTLAASAIAPFGLAFLPASEAQACSITGSGTVNAPNAGDMIECTTDDAVNISTTENVSITIGGAGPAVVSPQDSALDTIFLDNADGSIVAIEAGGSLTSLGQPAVNLNGVDSSTIVVAEGGDISASGAPFGVAIWMNTASDNTITVHGSISGHQAISFGSGSGNIFTNTGTMTGASGAAVFFGTAAGEANTLINAGTIEGVIQTTDGDETVINSGVINGGVFLGAGNDILELRAGYSITGQVRGGVGGLDTLRFGGSADTGFNLSLLGTNLQYDQFESIVQTGAASWTLTGSSAFAGTLVPNNSGILLNGSLVNAQTQVQNGWLGGAGAAGNVSIGVGGFLRPGLTAGSDIGTLGVSSLNFNVGAGGYVVDIAPDGSSDQIAASGTVVINGGTVMINPIVSSGYTAGTTYTIITASGGVSGTFSDLQLLDTPLIAGNLSYDANNVYFELLQVLGFADAAQTPNQQSIGEALDEILASGGASADLDATINALAVQPSDSLEAGLDDLAGQFNADTFRFLSRLGAEFHRFVASSTRGEGGAQRLWYGLYHHEDHQDGEEDAFGYDGAITGGAIGLRLYQTEEFTAGIAAGFSTGDMESDGQNDKAESSALHLAGYAQARAGGFELRGDASLGFASLDIRRELEFLSETASGEADALLFGVSFDVAYPIAFTETTTVSPYLALGYFAADRDGYAETGAPGVNQILRGASDHVTDISAGARFAYRSEALVLSGDLGARHRVDNAAPEFTAALEGNPTVPFVIVGVEEPDLLALVGLESEWQVNDNSSLRIGYDGAFGDGAAMQSIRASVNMRF